MSDKAKEQLFEALAPREERVEILGRALIVRELESAADTAAFLDNADMSWKMIVRCVFREDGQPMFGDDDIPRLKRTAKLRLKPLSDAVLRVNGLDVDGAEKNSGAGPGAG
jgi:hypothetical protein